MHVWYLLTVFLSLARAVPDQTKKIENLSVKTLAPGLSKASSKGGKTIGEKPKGASGSEKMKAPAPAKKEKAEKGTTNSGASPTSAPLKLANVRYVRIDAPSDFLQISAIAVYNTKSVNVALNKLTTASPVYTGDACSSSYAASGPVDGVLANKDFNDCANSEYHSKDSSGDFWYVDLGASYDLASVVYYNRGAGSNTGRCVGYVISAQDASKNTVYTWTITSSALVQTYVAAR